MCGLRQRGREFPKIKTSLLAITIWALLALLPVSRLLNGSFPVFTVLWITVPLVYVWRVKDTSKIGFRSVPWRLFLQTSAINLGSLLLIMLIFEPRSPTYQRLLELVLSIRMPGTTFAWMVRFPKVPALGAMTLYSGLVTPVWRGAFLSRLAPAAPSETGGNALGRGTPGPAFCHSQPAGRIHSPIFTGILICLYLYLASHRAGWRLGSIPHRQHLAGLDLGNIMQSCFGGIYFMMESSIP